MSNYLFFSLSCPTILKNIDDHVINNLSANSVRGLLQLSNGSGLLWQLSNEAARTPSESFDIRSQREKKRDPSMKTLVTTGECHRIFVTAFQSCHRPFVTRFVFHSWDASPLGYSCDVTGMCDSYHLQQADNQKDYGQWWSILRGAKGVSRYRNPDIKILRSRNPEIDINPEN